MAAANGVADRVIVRGNCEAADLRDRLAPPGRPVVICDAEGYERTLLDIGLVPPLARAFILVEIHEVGCPGVGALLEERFRGTHRIEGIGRAERSTGDLPFRTLYMRLIPERFLLNLLDEWRTDGMAWLWTRPRDIRGGPGDASA